MWSMVWVSSGPMTKSGAEARARRYKPGDKSEITVFRGDELMTFHLVWEEAPLDACYLVVTEDAAEEVVANRKAWLQGK